MKKKLVTAIVLVLVICLQGVISFADNILEDLQSQQQELQEQKNLTNGQLEGVQVQLSETMQQVQNLSETINQTESEIDGLNTRLQTLQTSIIEEEQKLQIAQMDYDKQKKLFEDRMVAIYEAGETSYLDVLLSSKDITDFISNYYLISEIANYDTELLNQIDVQKKNIEETKETLDSQKKEYAESKKNAEKKAILLKNTQTVKNNYMAKLTDAEKQLQAKIDEIDQATREVEAQIMLIAGANSNTQYVGGVLAWPVPGYSTITSPFGMRVHPITGVYKLHTGMDIRAPIGANFVAANDGIVVKAEYNRAYGNMVMIDHGGGIMTLYAHGSEILVQLGQTVKRGDPILKVGSTGYSTGAHAHFEVRVNGTYVNPVDYFNKVLPNTEENSQNETESN
ncbi:MAG: murein hydrolase activator EnvC family protein [Clostridia bacterium]